MPFRFQTSDLQLCVGRKSSATLLRERMLELYGELLPKLKADQRLRCFVRPREKDWNRLSTHSPYVPVITRHSGGYKRASWVGFGDEARYPDPRVGIQFQFGLAPEDYWYGIWMQGDAVTRPSQLQLSETLDSSSPEEIATSIRQLGKKYWFWVRRDEDEDDDPFIDKEASDVDAGDAKAFKENLRKSRLWIWLSKNLDDICNFSDVPTDIITTTHELLRIYQWWSGIKSRGLTAEEAYNQLKQGHKLKLVGENEEIPTGQHPSLTNQREGMDALRRYILEIYQHQCALCDIAIDEILIASHISSWSKDKANRGNPQNVICLCTFHDRLFERNLLRIHSDYVVEVTRQLLNSYNTSSTMRVLLDNTRHDLRLPLYLERNKPDPKLLDKKLES